MQLKQCQQSEFSVFDSGVARSCRTVWLGRGETVMNFLEWSLKNVVVVGGPFSSPWKEGTRPTGCRMPTSCCAWTTLQVRRCNWRLTQHHDWPIKPRAQSTRQLATNRPYVWSHPWEQLQGYCIASQPHFLIQQRLTVWSLRELDRQCNWSNGSSLSSLFSTRGLHDLASPIHIVQAFLVRNSNTADKHTLASAETSKLPTSRGEGHHVMESH